jgi:hypothetical protein
MALNGTMVAIQTVTVGSGGAANITFSNIPQTYTDLKVVYSVRNDATGTSNSIFLSLNGSTSSFSRRNLYGDGSSAASAGGTSNEGGLTTVNSFTASTFSNGELYIPGYTSSNNKSISGDAVNENNATLAYTFLVASLWSNTAAITSLGISPNAGNFVQHSTATLYGISRTTAQIKATGGMVYEDSTHIYHAFRASGTFTPTQSISADILVIAGGAGGGGGRFTGGGGAGGLRIHNSQSLTATGYTVTVGAGGSSSNSGSNSQFGSLTVSNGGGTGGSINRVGANGGSGGGGGSYDVNYLAGGTASPSGQGNNGGTGGPTNYRQGGGGGGAGAVGGNAGSNAGNGGAGSSAYSSWGSATGTGENSGGTYYYAGGGGGGVYVQGSEGSAGTGGLGGGGAGRSGNAVTGYAGNANTGGGGGGAGESATGGAGGSGIVIVRYAK